MQISELRTNVIVRGPVLPEPVQVIRVVPMGTSVKLVGRGLTTGIVHQPILSAAQLTSLEAAPESQPFDGDPKNFKLGVEALRLGIAYEYDPYFSLSIVDIARIACEGLRIRIGAVGRKARTRLLDLRVGHLVIGVNRRRGGADV